MQIIGSKEKDNETLAITKAITNRLKKSNERHDREVIQSNEKVVELILKTVNVTNAPTSINQTTKLIGEVSTTIKKE